MRMQSFEPEGPLAEVAAAFNALVETAKAQAQPKGSDKASELTAADIHQATRDSVRALMLIRAYRMRGHFHAKLDPLGLVPVLELDDGRALSETRAICTYLEGLYPEPNLMGKDAEERAFIEMADRRIEFRTVPCAVG